jgi:hypothetical protein
MLLTWHKAPFILTPLAGGVCAVFLKGAHPRGPRGVAARARRALPPAPGPAGAPPLPWLARLRADCLACTFSDAPHAPPQCYDAAFLARLPALAATPLAAAEDLEQLKVLEHGHKLRVVTLGGDGDGNDGGDAEEELLAHGVDEPADVPKMEAALAARRARARVPAQRDT